MRIKIKDLDYTLAYLTRPIDFNWAHFLATRQAWRTPIVVAKDGVTLVDGLQRVAFGVRPQIRKFFPDLPEIPEEVECEVCDASTESEIVLERILRNLSDRKPFLPEDLYSSFTLLGSIHADEGKGVPEVPEALKHLEGPLLRRAKQGHETITLKGGVLREEKRLKYARRRQEALSVLKTVADSLKRLDNHLDPGFVQRWDYAQRMGTSRLVNQILSQTHRLLAKVTPEEQEGQPR